MIRRAARALAVEAHRMAGDSGRLVAGFVTAVLVGVL